MEKGQGKRIDTLQTDNGFTRKEYIEREAAIKRLERLFQLQAQTARSIIEAIPAADVVPVVRCGECKHYDNGWCHRVHNPTQYSKTPDDWFCADGERKDGDGE